MEGHRKLPDGQVFWKRVWIRDWQGWRGSLKEIVLIGEFITVSAKGIVAFGQGRCTGSIKKEDNCSKTGLVFLDNHSCHQQCRDKVS